MNEKQKLVQARPMNFDDVRALIKNLPVELQEQLISDTLAELPADSKSRTIQKQLGQSGLTIVMGGSNCSVNTDLCVQIQNAPNVDIPSILEALAEKSRIERSQ